MNKLILFSLFVLIFSSSNSKTCKMIDIMKEDCGYIGINKEGCEAQGCCWEESSVANVPWCFYAIGEGDDQTDIPGECDIKDTLKRDCGWSGINQATCEQEGCCWRESSAANVPWCYFPEGGEKTDVPIEECDLKDSDKVECGYMGIDQNECERLNCCWVPSKQSGIPWCYYREGEEPHHEEEEKEEEKEEETPPEPPSGDEIDWDFGNK